MENTKKYLEVLLSKKSPIGISPKRTALFEQFAAEEKNISLVKQIIENQDIMLDIWARRNRIMDIEQQHVSIPNATVDKFYTHFLDFKTKNWDDIVDCHFEGLENVGLVYDEKTETLKGNPSQSGDFRLTFRFKINGEKDEEDFHAKPISLIINANPKSLWKNLESDITDPFWKEDNVHEINKLGDRSIVVASKRGRSHANVGSFRDDDYAYRFFEKTGWSLVAVADGAGSAKFARQGAKIACDKVISYFEENLNEENSLILEDLILENQNKDIIEKIILEENTEDTDNQVVLLEIPVEETPRRDVKRELDGLIYKYLGGAAFAVHKEIERFAQTQEALSKDFHSTLIFALYKKLEIGYVILTFGVGDCPIAVLDHEMSEVKLMNWLDVGEFGGGTRFITMAEIFQNANFASRIGFKIVEDFKYLVLMTDGIYDAKFVVEANLEKIAEWRGFFDDLDGHNADDAKVSFLPENENIAQELSNWMDFWSPGNHDDRTLAVIF